MTTDDKPAPTNPLSLVNTHWLHKADQRVRVIVDVNKSGGFVMSIPERIEIVETVADLATLEADWERVKWMPGWLTEAEAAKVKPRTIRDGLVPLGPEDAYNGVKVSSFCMACRDGIARYEHGMQASVELCAEDSAKVVGAMSSVHVVGDKPAEFYRMAQANVGAKPAIEHPAPWRIADTGRNGASRVVDANGEYVVASGDPFEGIAFPDDRVMALVLAAPEMEALLRTIIERLDLRESDICALCDKAFYHAKDCPYSPAEALVARLDSAKVA